MAAADTCVQRTLEGIIRGTNFAIDGIGSDATRGLVQQFQLQFQRKLTRVYDLASPSFYYIEGPSEGNITMAKVVGPQGAPKLDCTCDANDIVLDAGPTLCHTQAGSTGLPQLESGAARYTLKNAMPYGLQGQGNANNFLIIFSISYLFNDIE